MTTPRDLEAVVRRAWCETLEVPACAGRWEEAGGDSLATLQLAYRIEQAIGRLVPLDLIRPDMTAGELAAALATPECATGGDDLPPVFLLPGQLGDGPSLARFRQRLAGHVRFELVAIADADADAATLCDIVATARHAANRIAARQPEGPLFIAGYSFGGSVALAAAAELLDAGRDVAHVAVFDGAFGDATLGLPSPRLRRRVRRHAGRMVSQLLAWDAGRRRVLAAADRLSPLRGLALRRLVLRRFRSDARLNWRPRPLDVPIFLALSDEFAPVAGPVWQRLYPHAEVTRVPGSHFGLFRDTALDVVAAAFQRYVAAHCQPAAPVAERVAGAA